MRISDCSSDVCSSDLVCNSRKISKAPMAPSIGRSKSAQAADEVKQKAVMMKALRELRDHVEKNADYVGDQFAEEARKIHYRSEEHTSELQSLMRTSYAVFCLKKQTQ